MAVVPELRTVGVALIRAPKERPEMSTKRPKPSAPFKAKLALAALTNKKTAAQLARRCDVHPAMISAGKRQLPGRAAVFFDKNKKEPKWVERVS
jgi:transposase-like protein